MNQRTFSRLALSLALACGSTVAFSQTGPYAGNYPGNYFASDGLSPSAYPVAPAAAGFQTKPFVATQGYNTQAPVQRGWVGPSSPYQLTAGNQSMLIQDQNIPQGHVHVPEPVQQLPPNYNPYPASPVPDQNVNPAMQNNSGAPMGYAPANTGTGCTSCGMGGTNYAAPAYGEVPSYGLQGGGSCGTPGCTTCGGHFGGGHHLGGHLGGQMGGHMGHMFGARNCGPTTWFGGASALYFNQQDGRYVRLTHDSNMPTQPLLSTRSARIQAAPGVDVFFGKYINCGRNAIVFDYWGLYPSDSVASVYPGGNLRSDLPFTTLGPGGAPATLSGIEMPAQNVYDWYDGAAQHRVTRNNSINNVEINLLGFGLGGAAFVPGNTCGSCGGGGCGSCGGCGSSCGSGGCLGGPGSTMAPSCCSRIRMSWLGGIRWLQFRDYLEYATTDGSYTDGDPTNDFYYRNTVVNDLLGFQLGGMATICAAQRINLYSGTKFGVYGNHMQFDTFAGNDVATATVVSANNYDGVPYDFSASHTRVAFIGEANLGVAARITRCWSGNFGYKAVALSNVATAVGQIPYNFANINDSLLINSSDSVILHGFVFGAAYNF